jgi:hypothetical protein
MATAPPPQTRDSLGEWLSSLPLIEGVRPVDRMPPSLRTPLHRPAYRRQRPPDERVEKPPAQEIISLVREAGVLRWRAGTTFAMAGQRRAGGRAALPAGEVVKQYAFERLDASQVYAALVGLDRTLTPRAGSVSQTDNGLRQLKGGTLVPFPDPRDAAGKRVLLFIHGTFSNTEALIDRGFQQTPEGRQLLADAEGKYDLVLAYDHPTLSVSPMLNAFDLAALLRPSPRSVDIVCHSRGGLVARWFCEAYADSALKRRVVFVGSPLAGTSLAAAPRLRSTLDLLTNIADALRSASDLAAAHPLFLAASGLLRVVSTVTSLTAKTPVLDAAIALVPGLDAQSRTGNNEEIRRLRANTGTADFSSGQIRYFAVRANFEPKDIGWNFLRLFSKPMQRLGDWGADIIFDGRNDLVVDTASMAEVADNRLVAVAHDFGTTDRVHHTNYFVQPETARAVRPALSTA